MRKKKTKTGVDISSTYGMPENENKITWLVVANRSGAQVFEHEEADRGLELIREMDHPEGRMKGREIVTDRPGRSFESYPHSKGTLGGGTGGATTARHALSSEDSPTERETQAFCDQMAEWLETQRAQGAFHQLILIMAPPMLGTIRSRLPSPLKQTIIAEEEKNYGWLSRPDLQKRLASLLPGAGQSPPRHVPPPLGAQRVPKDTD